MDAARYAWLKNALEDPARVWSIDDLRGWMIEIMESERKARERVAELESQMAGTAPAAEVKPAPKPTALEKLQRLLKSAGYSGEQVVVLSDSLFDRLVLESPDAPRNMEPKSRRLWYRDAMLVPGGSVLDCRPTEIQSRLAEAAKAE